MLQDSGRGIFEVLPTGLFGPLVAPGATVYARILLALFREWQKHVQPLSREAALYVISSAIGDPEAMRLTQDAADEEPLEEPAGAGDGGPVVAATPGSPEDGSGASPELPDAATLQARAGAVLRYLTRRGWLRMETQPDFSQIYLFPGYAARLLAALVDITSGTSFAAQGLIFPIYDTLHSTIEGGEADARLPQAHRQTGELLVQLRELRDNIGAYLDRIMGQMLPRDVLDQMLTQYRDEIQARMLHYLHTTEHVSRYRPEVIEALSQLESAGQIEAAARILYQRKEFASLESARERLHEQAREIRDQFQSLDALLEAIDVRHSQFVDAAVRSIELHLTRQSTTSGQLNGILEYLLTRKHTKRQFATVVDAVIQLDQLAWIAPESLAAPRRAGKPFVPEPETDWTPSEAELEQARRAIVLQMQQKLTQDRVRNVVRQLLEGRTLAMARELPIAGPDDLPLVILVREFGREGAYGYAVEELPDAPWVELQDVGFRDFRIRAVPDKEYRCN